MTRRKRKWLLLGMLTVGALLPFALWRTASGHRINEASSFKIARGMAAHEVEAIVRVPPGDYTTGPLGSFAVEKLKTMRELFPEQLRLNERNPQLILRLMEWLTDDGALFVYFDDNGKVLNAGYFSFSEEPPLLERIREWLGV